jgi:pimeloyl-ACP methyl ester carboxylesterase
MKATIETLERGIDGSKKVVIQGAGHMVNMEKPDIFNEAVLSFLRQQPRPPSSPPPAESRSN